MMVIKWNNKTRINKVETVCENESYGYKVNYELLWKWFLCFTIMYMSTMDNSLTWS